MKLRTLLNWFLNLLQPSQPVPDDTNPKSRQLQYQEANLAKGLCRVCKNVRSVFSKNYCSHHLEIARERAHKNNRQRSGIPLSQPRCKAGKPRAEDDWKDSRFYELLGNQTDSSIAKLYGVSSTAVTYHRKLRGLPRYVKPHRRKHNL